MKSSILLVGDRYTLTEEEKQALKHNFEHIYTMHMSKNIKQIEKFLQKMNISYIVFNVNKQISSEFKKYLKNVPQNEVTLMTFSELYTRFLHHSTSRINVMNHKILLEIKFHSLQKILKRLFDLVFSFFFIIFFLPFMLMIALWIKVKSPEGTIFFTQKCLGLYGTFFTVYKFRTMLPNAENSLETLLENNPKIKEEYLCYRKLKEDPRIIPGIGTFLKKTSLDELPQFFNVFFGDMSIVGPRPYFYQEFHAYNQTHIDIITSVKPGITGLWQVTDRHASTFDSRMNTDIRYITNQTLWGDIKIIFKTIQVIILGKGI